VAALEKSFALALDTTLVKLGKTPEQILQGQLEFTQLPWQVPPIIVDAALGGRKLQEYFDEPMKLNEKAFYTFWLDAMQGLMDNPSKTFGLQGYRRLVGVTREHAGIRLLRFSKPEGFPDKITDYAGAILSLECAHACRVAGLAREFCNTDSDYWVVTHSGYEIGVRNGLPISGAERWDTSVSGIVQELLRMPRGDVFYGCDYDLVSRLRSFLHAEKHRLLEFEAADWALQALRVLLQQRHSPNLLRQVQRLETTKRVFGARLEAFREADGLMETSGYSDRQKLQVLKDTLVPEFLTRSRFSREIYPYNAEIPAVLSQAALWRVQGGLKALLRIEEALHADKI
jgi:hypothetical protein